MRMSILLHCFTVHKLQIGYIECKGNVENDTHLWTHQTHWGMNSGLEAIL